MGSPFRRKPRGPVTFGEKGLVQVKCLGDLPQQFRGRVSGKLYVWREEKPVLPVDRRDLSGLVRDGGRASFEGLPAEEKPEPVKRATIEKKGKTEEGVEAMTDGEPMADDG